MAEISNTHLASTPVENARGAVLMTLAMAGYGINDIIVKHAAASLELGQTLLIRGLFATLFIWLLARATGGLSPIRAVFQPAMIFRASAEMLATITFLLALFNMPIANATAILQASPLAVTLGAAIFFGEKFGWRRTAAIIIGFIGVIVVIRPGMEGFTIYSIAALTAVFFITIRDLSTRFISKKIPTLFIALFSSILVTMVGGGLSIFENWVHVDMVSVGWLILASGFLILGYFCIAGAMRVGDIGVIIPFRYTILIYAIIAGIIFFDEIPDLMSIVGSLIIVGTGIFTVYRERLFRES
ncbi:MAG: DMT family transporter [Hyphomicrobiales bacterium]|nr:DMT family transporter [Hyphomicrobiales bacterium]